jgi:hypothetical protein
VHQGAFGLTFEPLIELEAMLVEGDGLGDTVVRADHGRVAPRIAATDVAGLHDGDVGDAVSGREVVRGREPMTPSADDDHLVPTAGFGPRELDTAFGELVHANRSSRS